MSDIAMGTVNSNEEKSEGAENERDAESTGSDKDSFYDSDILNESDENSDSDYKTSQWADIIADSHKNSIPNEIPSVQNVDDHNCETGIQSDDEVFYKTNDVQIEDLQSTDVHTVRSELMETVQDVNVTSEVDGRLSVSNGDFGSEDESIGICDCKNDLVVEKQNDGRDVLAVPTEEEFNTDDNKCINIFLDQCTDKAEARLAARRQARAEAREIRMRELERQQKEQEENADRAYDMLAEPLTRTPRTGGIGPRTSTTGLTNSAYLSSRRSSEDSLEDGASLRDVRHELKDMEEKFRKAMIANAQLDNDKAAQTYQLELLKDRIEELEEDHSQLKREHREMYREYEQLKRVAVRLKEDLAMYKTELEERDRLIAEKGLVIVGEEVSEDEENGGGDNVVQTPKKALVSVENAELLENAGQGSLDVRLKRFAEEKRELMDQISHIKLELEEEKSRRKRRTSSVVSNVSLQNGPNLESDSIDIIDVQREANKQLADYKFRVQKLEQDNATLQANVARLESQVIRYKSAAEASEKAEDELKVEKRKLQREARESQSRVEELETANNHLQRRLEKLKNAKSALLKEL